MTIEEFAVAYLSAHLTGVTVAGDAPTPLPATFVTVEQTAARESDEVRSATLAVQCYAASRAAAGQLCQTVIAAMEGMEAEDAISRVQLNTSSNFPDTARRRPRYQAVFDITHYL